jgi:integrase
MGVYKRGDTYYIDYYFSGKRVRQKVGPNKKQAQAALAKIEASIAEGKFLDVRKAPPPKSLAALCKEFLEWSQANKRSWRRDELCVRHLRAFFGDCKVTDISAFQIEKYKQQRKQEVSPRTVNIEIQCMSVMLNKAVRWGYLAANPATGVRKLQEPPARARYLGPEEVGRLLAACSDKLRPIVIVALHTGARRGEILGLRWEDLDLEQRTIRVADSKNGEARTVPMTDTVRKVLTAHEAARSGDCPWVFPSSAGGRRDNVNKAWQSARKRAGLGDFRFHDLRHTAASHLAMAGVDLRAIQEILGHKTFAMTLRYSHLSPQHKARAVLALDAAIPVGNGTVTIWSQAGRNQAPA